MAIALDYTTRIDPAALRAAGVTVVCRYLSWLYRWAGQTHTYINPKIIQRSEYRELASDGLQIVLNWEYDEHDWLGGKDAGTAHAVEAVRQAKLLGHPAGAVIAGSSDFDMSQAQWDAAGHAYASSWEAGVRAGGFVPGVYGPWDVLTWCRDETGIGFFWQAGMSTSYSDTRNRNAWPGAHLRQRGAKTVGGISGDWNDILRSWEAAMAQLDYGRQGPPTQDPYATDLERATTGQAVFLADLAGHEVVGHSLYNGTGKSYRGQQLDRIEALAQAAGGGGVDLDLLAAKVAVQLAPLVPTAAQVAAQLIVQLGAK